MILRGATPQSLTRRGLLLLGGLGLVLLPFVPTVAQTPAKPNPDAARAAELLQALVDKHAQDEARLAAKLTELGPESPLGLAQPQEDLRAQCARLQQQLAQLHAALEHLKAAANAVGKTPAGQRPGGPAGMPKVFGGGRGSGMPGGMPGMERPGGPPAAGMRGNVEQRLEVIEKKLDILLWEITNLRREMRPMPGHPAPVHVGGPTVPRPGNPYPGGGPPAGPYQNNRGSSPAPPGGRYPVPSTNGPSSGVNPTAPVPAAAPPAANPPPPQADPLSAPVQLGR